MDRIPMEIKLSARDVNGRTTQYTYYLDDVCRLVKDGHLHLTTGLTTGEGPDGIRTTLDIKIPDGI
jgi:hypothetical protein